MLLIIIDPELTPRPLSFQNRGGAGLKAGGPALRILIENR